ncbi:MAG: hypothetical protein CM1200mP3_00730 [Chloroflexota bacterium]|nr:MAG: hypothetical protein CM1200mP3_00730 [Chloroflexota bacterium]
MPLHLRQQHQKRLQKPMKHTVTASEPRYYKITSPWTNMMAVMARRSMMTVFRGIIILRCSMFRPLIDYPTLYLFNNSIFNSYPTPGLSREMLQILLIRFHSRHKHLCPQRVDSNRIIFQEFPCAIEAARAIVVLGTHGEQWKPLFSRLNHIHP